MWNQLLSSVSERQETFNSDIELWLKGYTRGKGRIYCELGCSNCCNLLVNATFPEALQVATHAPDLDTHALNTHILELRNTLTQSNGWLSFMRNRRKRVGYCPLLTKEGCCSIYEYRPFSCRALLSTRNHDWCAVDFSELPPIDKSLYLSSLDRTVVAYPVHYVEATQAMGHEHENAVSLAMESAFGFSITGNLILLVHLEREFQLSRSIVEGYAATINLLEREDLLHPYLLNINSTPPLSTSSR